jgi:hypothetical protein
MLSPKKQFLTNIWLLKLQSPEAETLQGGMFIRNF